MTEQLPTCTGCGAPIRWVLTLGDKRMPIDPDPHPEGTIVRVDANGTVRAKVLTGTDLPAQDTAWRPHWATCPASGDYRRRQRATTPKCVDCRHPLDPVLAAAGQRRHPTCGTPADDLRARVTDQRLTPPDVTNDDVLPF